MSSWELLAKFCPDDWSPFVDGLCCSNTKTLHMIIYKVQPVVLKVFITKLALVTLQANLDTDWLNINLTPVYIIGDILAWECGMPGILISLHRSLDDKRLFLTVMYTGE